VASAFGGISALINSSVFLLAFTYMATCISAILLQAKHEDISKKLIGKKVIPMTGAAFSIVLLLLVAPLQIMISLCLLGVGVPIYIFFSPKQELTEAKEKFLSKRLDCEEHVANPRHSLECPSIRSSYIDMARPESAMLWTVAIRENVRKRIRASRSDLTC
jgi:amino acid transporter